MIIKTLTIYWLAFFLLKNYLSTFYYAKLILTFEKNHHKTNKMKKIIVLLVSISLLACKKDENKDAEPGIMDAVESVNQMSKAADELKDFEKRSEELKKIKPVSNDVFKELLPETLDGLKRSSYTAGAASMVGLSSAEAGYGESGSKLVKISIYDGAGESGSAMITMTNMTLAMDSESINQTVTKKNEEINGIRCMTENDSNPNYNRSSITYIYNNRFQITLDGQQMELDELKTYMDKLDLSKLK